MYIHAGDFEIDNRIHETYEMQPERAVRVYQKLKDKLKISKSCVGDAGNWIWDVGPDSGNLFRKPTFGEFIIHYDIRVVEGRIYPEDFMIMIDSSISEMAEIQDIIEGEENEIIKG